ncbi:hypothetical protein OS493_040092, partial [Desmophyllum pertusum]
PKERLAVGAYMAFCGFLYSMGRVEHRTGYAVACAAGDLPAIVLPSRDRLTDNKRVGHGFKKWQNPTLKG